MNPWPVARAALRRGWRVAVLMALLVAMATAMGVAAGSIERGLRRSAARAADAFDLVIGAPGSGTQLVLTSVYLQPDTVPLLDSAVLSRVLAEPEVAWASPIGFGDQWHGHPVVGVAPDFVTQGGRRGLAEGRVFTEEQEAVVGASVPLGVGATFEAGHGRLELPEAGLVHSEAPYRVVGRLPPSGTPWDAAILVPIESVWELHGLGNGHAQGEERVGPPWERAAGVPAVVVKPRSFGGAYQLRARYRAADSLAVFPGEVLASLFRTLGDVRAVVSWVAGAAQALVVAAVFLAFGALVAARGREHAVLRAIGAPRGFIVAALWLELGVVLLAGVAAGLAFGWACARLAAGMVTRASGVVMEVGLSWPELWLAATVLGCGLLAGALPAVLAGQGRLKR